MVFPLFSGLLASSTAAQSAAPEVDSRQNSFFFGQKFSCGKSVIAFYRNNLSYISVFRTSGTKPAPIPCSLCGPLVPFDSTGESAGSTALFFTSGFCSFRYSPLLSAFLPYLHMPQKRLPDRLCLSRSQARWKLCERLRWPGFQTVRG